MMPDEEHHGLKRKINVLQASRRAEVTEFLFKCEELGLHCHIKCSRVRNVHIQYLLNATRFRAHYKHPVTEHDRIINIVSYEHNGFTALFPNL